MQFAIALHRVFVAGAIVSGAGPRRVALPAPSRLHARRGDGRRAAHRGRDGQPRRQERTDRSRIADSTKTGRSRAACARRTLPLARLGTQSLLPPAEVIRWKGLRPARSWRSSAARRSPSPPSVRRRASARRPWRGRASSARKPTRRKPLPPLSPAACSREPGRRPTCWPSRRARWRRPVPPTQPATARDRGTRYELLSDGHHRPVEADRPAGGGQRHGVEAGGLVERAQGDDARRCARQVHGEVAARNRRVLLTNDVEADLPPAATAQPHAPARGPGPRTAAAPC